MPKAGELISATQNTASSTRASGVWNLNQAYDFVRTNQWPNATGIGRSLVFNADDSAYLSRTPATAGNRKTWTWSGWVKLASPGTNRILFGAAEGQPNRTELFFYNGDQLFFEMKSGDNFVIRNYPGNRFRDPSAWYHIVAVFDSDNSNSDDRQRLYVNGELLDPNQADSIPQGLEGFVNSASVEHKIGTGTSYSSPAFDGYMAEINFVDGEALEPDEFGRVDPEFGHWVPRRYSGTYGTNGFYLDFSDSSSNSALGTDKSGNANDWTPNGFNSAEDLVTDSPTEYGTDFGRGGEVRGNFATLNPLYFNPIRSNKPNLSNGNLEANGVADAMSEATIATTSGKYYYEAFTKGDTMFGIGIPGKWGGDNPGANEFAIALHANGDIQCDGVIADSGVSFNDNNIHRIMVAYDHGANRIWFGVDGVWGQSGNPGASTGGQAIPSSMHGYQWIPAFRITNSGSDFSVVNFGQKPFSYPAPEGFKCLTTRNLDQPSIVPGNYFNTVLYTGNGTAIGSGGQEITGAGFEPDWVWIKERSSSSGHLLFDQVRGATNYLSSHSTSAESTSTEQLASFDTDGFTVGSSGAANESGQTYVAWNWKANGSGVAGDNGSTISANPTAGFCIVKYTGNGDTSSSAPRYGTGGIGSPDLIIYKRLDSTGGWTVQSRYLPISITASYLLLNSTAAQTVSGSSVGNFGSSGIRPRWTDATNGNNISGADYVAYVFAPVAGYSAFGSYTGNGSTDGPFVYTGFRPAFVMLKRTDSTGTWQMLDNKRDPYNVTDKILVANAGDAEFTGTGSGGYLFDFTSNGFKIREDNALTNASGDNFIYMAFAETPFKISRAR